MPDIKLLREPGFIYDLDFVFHLRFNLKSYLKNLEGKVDNSEANSYFSSILDSFGDISDDLYVFFHAIEDERTFLPEFYITPYKEQFASSYNFNFLINELSDHSKLTENLFRFYFYNLSEEEILECIDSKDILFHKIKNSNYPTETKLKLYEFFIDPTPYIQSLQFSLMEKRAILDQYYEKNYQKIIDIYNQTSFNTLTEEVRILYNLSYIANTNQDLYTSYCLLNKYCVIFIPANFGAVYLLGSEYHTAIKLLKNQKSVPNIQKFGHAIGDENRAKILQLLLERGEITRKDLEKTFSFSGTTAYHHITVMTNAGVIKTRNEGKVIVYSLNREYFDSILTALQRYSTKEV